VYHPEFISSNDLLFGMDYDQFVRGCHLGIFPSSYEPWGYTPLECVARGTPAVTSDLSGFGSYLLQHVSDHAQNGLYVLGRRLRSFEEAADDLAEWLFQYAQMERRDRIDLRNRAEGCADRFDWSVMARHYFKAYDMARKNAGV
jgi:glycogen(starch) synthase